MARIEWTYEEILASVEAYQEMLDKELAGQPYNKTEVRRGLLSGALSGRTNGSIEMRMCNISTVLHDQGERYINGYKPRENVGTHVHLMIRKALAQVRSE